MKTFLKDNGLSLVLLLIFLFCLVGHSVAGWLNHNEEQAEHHNESETFSEYLGTGAFGESVFENWESEFLQMALYVILTAFLFQRGSAESKDPDAEEEVDEDPVKHQQDPQAPGPVRAGGWRCQVYGYSLSIAFLLLFLLSFIGHAWTGMIAHNEEAVEHGQPLEQFTDYISGAQFWFESFQNWQSEFLAIFAIVVLSIWLRQYGSPESKPVAAPHTQTGS